jgi:Domain of unknown function (DUF5911)
MSNQATSSGNGSASADTPGRYRPIGDYAFLGDCHTGALVSSDGSVDWLCLPRLDDGSYFGRLLDRERGGWCSITPADPAVRTSRRYVDGTLVLETEMAVAGGRVRVTDCLTTMRPGGAGDPTGSCCGSSTAWKGPWTCGSRWCPGSTTGRCGRGSAAPGGAGRGWAATTG